MLRRRRARKAREAEEHAYSKFEMQSRLRRVVQAQWKVPRDRADLRGIDTSSRALIEEMATKPEGAAA
jgi:hypothetical protein